MGSHDCPLGQITADRLGGGFSVGRPQTVEPEDCQDTSESARKKTGTGLLHPRQPLSLSAPRNARRLHTNGKRFFSRPCFWRCRRTHARAIRRAGGTFPRRNRTTRKNSQGKNQIRG